MRYGFADGVLDTQLYTIERGGQALRLRPKAFEVCRYLLEHRDRFVSKNELLEAVWPEQYISDTTLQSVIKEIRQAVGDTGRTQHVIQTLHRRGYRFVATVSVAQGTALAPEPPDHVLPGLPALPVTLPLPGPAPLPLVGRTQELATLEALSERLQAGQGHAVCLVGDAGMGASRLLASVHQRVQGQPITVLEAHGHPWGARFPYGALHTLLWQLCRLTMPETGPVRRAQVAHCLAEAGIPPAARLAYVLRLLGDDTAAHGLASMSPATVRARTLATLRALLLARSRQQPILLLCDDLHWWDATSQSWLASLVAPLADVPLLVLATCRPGTGPAWRTVAQATEIVLTPLAPPSSLQLLHAILPEGTVSAAVYEAILARASGHPLYLEECARLALTQHATGTAVALPDTLAGVIAARLAQLSKEAREVVQTAAVLGPRGRQAVLTALWEAQTPLPPVLLELEHQGWYSVDSTVAAPTYRFRHPLHWEVAYASLTPLARQRLHGAAAQALTAPGASGPGPDHVLWPLHQAHAVALPQAITLLTQMAMQATAHEAHAEALCAVQAANDALVSLPVAAQSSFDPPLRLAQATALLGLRRFQEVVELLQPLTPALVSWGSDAQHARRALLLSQAARHLGAWDQARHYAYDAVVAAQHSQDDRLHGQAQHALALACYWAEDPATGLKHSRQAVHLLTPGGDADALGIAYLVQGLHALLYGDVSLALKAVAQAETLGTTTEEPALQAYAAWLTGWIHATRGAGDDAIAACRRSLAVAVEPLHTAFAQGWLGYAYVEQGSPAAAIPLLAHAIVQMQHYGQPRCAGLYTSVLAAAHLHQGALETAQALAQEGLTQSRATAHRLGTGWAQRVLGQIALAADTPAEAWRYGQAALATFTTVPARLEMGRTHLLLGEIAQAQGQPATARQHVTAAHQAFQDLDVSP